jgi:hypothetical protein
MVGPLVAVRIQFPMAPVRSRQLAKARAKKAVAKTGETDRTRKQVTEPIFKWEDDGMRYEVYALGRSEAIGSGRGSFRGPSVVVRTLSRSGESREGFKIDDVKLWKWLGRLAAAGSIYLREHDIFLYSEEMDAVLVDAKAEIRE